MSPVTQINCELVRFDLQKLQNPEITDIQYQQGTLFGYEVREYLLEKFNRQCVYCDSLNVPLQIEHIQPKSKGGSNRISNLAIACQCCNQKKNSQTIQEFLEHDKLRLNKIMKQVKAPLKDAAAVNATRWKLVNSLKSFNLPVMTASGGQTKFNRIKLNLPKTHAIDSVCVGQTDSVSGENKPTLTIKSMGRGSYQRTILNKYGFSRGYLMRNKSVHGFQTGDRVCANVLKGKKAGIYTGRIAVRASGSFNIQTSTTVIQGISYQYCKIIQRADGYLYDY